YRRRLRRWGQSSRSRACSALASSSPAARRPPGNALKAICSLRFIFPTSSAQGKPLPETNRVSTPGEEAGLATWAARAPERTCLSGHPGPFGQPSAPSHACKLVERTERKNDADKRKKREAKVMTLRIQLSLLQ